MVDFNNPYYPYEKTLSGANTMDGASDIPYKIVTYLLDMPDAAGYVPVDDNTRPRVRLAKYLWHDGENPLSQPLPTPQEKLSMLFDGTQPVLNTEEERAAHPRGYRIFPQRYVGQSELYAQTTLKAYTGRVIPITPFRASIGLSFEIIVNSNFENTTRRSDAYARTYAMETSIISALHGVNIVGVGVINFNRNSHQSDGSNAYWDSGTHVYRVLNMSVDWMES